MRRQRAAQEFNPQDFDVAAVAREAGLPLEEAAAAAAEVEAEEAGLGGGDGDGDDGGDGHGGGGWKHGLMGEQEVEELEVGGAQC